MLFIHSLTRIEIFMPHVMVHPEDHGTNIQSFAGIPEMLVNH